MRRSASLNLDGPEPSIDVAPASRARAARLAELTRATWKDTHASRATAGPEHSTAERLALRLPDHGTEAGTF